MEKKRIYYKLYCNEYKRKLINRTNKIVLPTIEYFTIITLLIVSDTICFVCAYIIETFVITTN